MNKTKPFGRRILVEKEKIDVGGMRLTPTQEEDGQKNAGRVVAVGQVGWLARFRGIRVGATVTFKKFFVCNDGTEDSLVFVDLDAVTGIDYD